MHFQDAAQQARAADHFGVFKSKLVYGKRQIHDSRELSLPFWRLRDSFDEQKIVKGQSHAEVEVFGENASRC